MTHDQDDQPRSLGDPGVRERRRRMLSSPHVAGLTALVADLRQRVTVSVPDFDPLGGGEGSTILFLFEKPGPMTDASRNRKAGSGFISINNDDPTAEAAFHFMKAPRSRAATRYFGT